MRACQSCVRLPSKQSTPLLGGDSKNKRGLQIYASYRQLDGTEVNMWLALSGGAAKQRPIMVMKCRLSASADYKRVGRVTSSYQFVVESYFHRHPRCSRSFSGLQTRTPTLYALLTLGVHVHFVPLENRRHIFDQLESNSIYGAVYTSKCTMLDSWAKRAEGVRR